MLVQVLSNTQISQEAAVMQERALAPLTTHPERAARGLILLGAFVSFVLSVSLFFGGHQQQGIFVGIWVPSILSLGALLVRREP